MKNPYYVAPVDALFNNAAEAVRAYMQARPGQEDISKAELAGLAEVQAVAGAGFDLQAEGVQAEILSRVKALV